jgi:hypothetical protein
MASLQRKKKKNSSATGLLSHHHSRLPRHQCTTVNDSASILGNTLLLLLFCLVGLLHAERVLLTFLQQGR